MVVDCFSYLIFCFYKFYFHVQKGNQNIKQWSELQVHILSNENYFHSLDGQPEVINGIVTILQSQ